MKICWKSMLLGVIVGAVGMHFYMGSQSSTTK